jgi:purine-nucleoside phosphorylase
MKPVMRDAADLVLAKTPIRPSIGVVLGSGLGAFADSLAHSVRIRYEHIPGMPRSTAVGHAGELVIGTLGANGRGSVDVAVMSGRFHQYEGYGPRDVAAGVRLLGHMGVEQLVLTNAAGGVNPAYAQGALVLVSDHINLQGTNPLTGPNDPALGPRFPDMTEAYSPELRQLARDTASDLQIDLQEGVYAAVVGPSYETPAEIRFLRIIGADLVGMSTVAETIAAKHMGIEVVGISCVTNMAAGMTGEKISHEEVLETGRRVSGTLVKLLSALLPRMQ